ncbi:MAG TPA: glycoside hydrolase family 76 protein [Candidatus Cybelea sp.]|jgi:predicted alpha-1,6-mannanase (GH76 family)|nr:glycoside hydrolase family 76 protein [Candidatus Cybelea sp.]
MWRRYSGYADAAYRTLVENWYDAGEGSWSDLRFWQQACAMHVIADYAALRPVDGILEMFRKMFQANSDNNFTVYSHQGVYDDEGWWALAWLAVHDLFKNSRISDEQEMAADALWIAQFIFNNMSSQWTWRCNGGCCWDMPEYAISNTTAQWTWPCGDNIPSLRPFYAPANAEFLRYKNAIVNELFFTLAVRLYQRTNKPRFLDWAKTSLNWFNRSGMKNACGLINDGLSSSCRNSGGAVWTYNQGVILGGLADMYKVTGDYSTYIEGGAWPLFQAVASSSLVRDNVLTESAPPDDEVPQFKGVFMRYLGYLASVDPDPDGTHQPEYLTFIAANANSLWLSNRNDSFFGYSWTGPFDEAGALRQSAALDALVVAIRLDSF